MKLHELHVEVEIPSDPEGLRPLLTGCGVVLEDPHNSIGLWDGSEGHAGLLRLTDLLLDQCDRYGVLGELRHWVRARNMPRSVGPRGPHSVDSAATVPPCELAGVTP